MLKRLVTQKKIGFPSSVQDFFWFITCTFKRPSLRLFRFKIHYFVPFFISFMSPASTRRGFFVVNQFDPFWLQLFEIFLGNFRKHIESTLRLGCLKVYVKNQKMSRADGETLQKKLSDQSL